MDTRLQQIIVPFHDEQILTVETPDGIFVPVRPICERLRLDWKSQHSKLRAAPERWGVVIITTPSAGGPQEMACIPLNRLAWFLATINPNKVRADLKEAVLHYQNEAADVLDRHFRGRQSEEIALLRRFNRNLTTQMLVAKPFWNKAMRLYEAGYFWVTIGRLLNRSEVKFRSEWEAMQDCGLVPDWPGTPGHQLRLALREERGTGDA